jgi:predicted metal-binding membrane protein
LPLVFINGPRSRRRAYLNAKRQSVLFLRHGGLRSTPTGSLNLGVRHGVYCVGCCWALMLLLFALGVMNLLWIAALAILIMLEKVIPFGRAVARLAGLLFIAGGGWMLFQHM